MKAPAPGRRGVAGAGPAGERGQALVLLVGAMLALVSGAAALGWLSAGLASAGDRQRAADLAALAGARALLDARPRVLGTISATRRAAYLAAAAQTARVTARRNGARRVEVSFAREPLPARVTVVVRDRVLLVAGLTAGGSARAEAELSLGWLAADGEYRGPLEMRQGKPMRPDVALAFDRLDAAARVAGHRLAIASAFRSATEQSRLFAANPDPRWVAPAGRSLHRLATELDLGPPSAYGWLRRNAGRFGFIRRYSWEPWHFGFGRSPGSASVGFGAAAAGASALPAWVPARYKGALIGASRRHGVGAALLAAQIQQESGFDARAVSRSGALGVSQFMPATAKAYGLTDPFDASSAIDAQARLMRDLLGRFGSVPLALAAYNAGAGRVGACFCVPPIPETQTYVRRIVAMARGDLGAGAATSAAPVRLVR